MLNKIDLASSDPDNVKSQIEDIIGIDASEALLVSAKSGIGIKDVLEAIVSRLPAPSGNLDNPLKAILVDTWYDTYLGIVILLRVVDGIIKKGMKIIMISNNAVYQVDNIGIFTPHKKIVEQLAAGEIGFITASIKELSDCKIGDTITEEQRKCDNPMPGFRAIHPVVFCSVFPNEAGDFERLREALKKLQLNDAKFYF